MTKVLVVDDDPMLAEVCGIVLEQEGFSVDTATDGLEALRKVETGGVDLVLLDLMMPEMDGITLCRELRASPVTRRLPLIAMSASRSLLEQSVQFADATVMKPFDIDHLANTVRSLTLSAVS